MEKKFQQPIFQQPQQWSNIVDYQKIDDYFTNSKNQTPEILKAYQFNTQNINNKNISLINFLSEKGVIVSKVVENVMKSIDRADFVKINPYFDSSQPLGFSVVVSAPHIHAYALVQIECQYIQKEILKDACIQGNKCLDVGSGTGYLTVALAKMMEKNKGICYGIEHIPTLAQESIINIKKNHAELLLSKRVQIYEGEGRLGSFFSFKSKGLSECGPFDIIHVGAGVNNINEIPRALLEQLKPGGRMLIPVGLPNEQQFASIEKDYSGNYNMLNALGVYNKCFVPLTSKKTQLQQNN